MTKAYLLRMRSLEESISAKVYPHKTAGRYFTTVILLLIAVIVLFYFNVKFWLLCQIKVLFRLNLLTLLYFFFAGKKST